MIHEWNDQAVEPMADSDRAPIAVLIQDDDLDASTCGECGLPGEDWERATLYAPNARPGVIYQADTYCAACFPFAYDAETGERVDVRSGEPSQASIESMGYRA